MPSVARNGRGVFKLDAVSRELAVTFVLRGQTWRIPSDPDVEFVATMLQLEQDLGGSGDGERGASDTAASIVEARELILDMLESEPQDQPVDRGGFRIGVGEILTLFVLITGGPARADQAANALRVGMSQARDEPDTEPSPPASRSRPASRRSSPARSTGSRGRGGGA